MLRGIHKNVIQMRLSGNRYFESAYLILKRNPSDKDTLPHYRQDDMLREANRILEDCDLRRSGSRRSIRLRGKLFPFFCGLLLGASLVAFLWLTVLLFI